MNAVVFTGPSLPPGNASVHLEALYLPPVRQGDLYRAAKRYKPHAIGIIDGHFQQVPAVWHKEILWAMSQGIHVYGSSSMGALRAAELQSFGMCGVGRIFAAYRDGVLAPYTEPFEDEDEVAVVHGPAQTGYVTVSEAMVNMRLTFERARVAGIVSTDTRDLLVAAGKALFYKQRNYETVLRAAAERGAREAEIDALRSWLREGRLNQKRDDALSMLTALDRLLASNPPPLEVCYVFRSTGLWQQSVQEAEGSAEIDPDTDKDEEQAVLEELRVDPRRCARVTSLAVARSLVLAESERRGVDPDEATLRRSLRALRKDTGLSRPTDIDAWMGENDTDDAGLQRLCRTNAMVEALEAQLAPRAALQVLDLLRLSGDYARLARRARAKLATIGGPGMQSISDLDRLRALIWHFETRLGGNIPEDLATHAARLGFSSVRSFQDALVREYCFVQLTSAPTGEEQKKPGGTRSVDAI